MKQKIKLISLSLLISFILRIPRVFEIIGTDSFYLMWESQLVLTGFIDKIIIHPSSVFGMYSPSPYPIGSVFLFTVFYLISFRNIYVSTALWIVIFLSLGAITSFRFFSVAFKKNGLAFLGSVLYLNIPITVYFSYNIASARLPFLALLPFFFEILLRIYRKKSIKDFLWVSLLFILLLFLHRMAMVLIMPLFCSGLYLLYYHFKINDKVNKRFEFNFNSFVKKHFPSIIIGSLVLLFLINFLILDLLGLAQISRTTFANNRFINHAISVVLSVFFDRWGFILIIGVASLALLWKYGISDSKMNKEVCYLLLIQLPLFIFMNGNYTPYLLAFFPLILILGAVNELKENQKINKNLVMFIILLINGSLQLLYSVIVNFTFAKIRVYLILFPLFGIVQILAALEIRYKLAEKIRIPMKINKKFKKYLVPSIILFPVLTYSFFYVDFQTTCLHSDDPFYYANSFTTEEEKQIIEFFSQKDPWVFGCASRALGGRIAGHTGWRDIADLHGLSLLVINYYTKSDIQEVSKLKSLFRWYQTHIYSADIPLGITFYNEIVSDNATSEQNVDIIYELNLNYFISFRDSNISETFVNNFIESPFIETLHKIAEPVLTTEKYIVWFIS